MLEFRLEELDAYTRIALPRILDRFPNWERHLAIHSGDGDTGSVARIALPPENASVDLGLWVWTDDGELTVGFHTHHSHFADYAENPTHHVTIAYGLDYAADVLADRIGVVSHYREGAFAGSSSVELPAPAPDKVFEQAPPPIGELFAGADAVTVRSWSGRFDVDFGNVAAIPRNA
jgi:hypothetical protein